VDFDDDVFFFLHFKDLCKKMGTRKWDTIFNMFLALSCLMLFCITHMLSLDAFVSSFALLHKGLFASHPIRVFTHTKSSF